MRKCLALALAGLTSTLLSASFASGQSRELVPGTVRGLVPGTGTEVSKVGDDFEDPNWSYIPNNPKSTEDIDKNQRLPIGKSTNGRWYEGVKRGHPDIVRRVPTPEGGILDSQGSLLMQSLFTGIPNRPSGVMHQEDFICNVQYRLGGPIPVSQSPSITTRVFLPPIEEWEKRSGPQFAFRAALETTPPKKPLFEFGEDKEGDDGIYWPGFFIVLESKQQTKKADDYAYFRIRANRNGGDFKGLQISTTGWWTLGMSFTPDGMVHYYARPGVDDLTEDDYVTSQMPYGYRCLRFRSFFYNVVNGDNGKQWTTPWIVDDPKVFVVNGGRLASPTPNSKRR